MKAIKQQFKTAALFLSILILFQGCSVYHKGTITLDEAVQEQKKVKISGTNNQIMHFKKIVLKDGKYYGVKKLNDNRKDVRLFDEYIKNIKSKNETMSIILTVLAVTGPIWVIGLSYLFGAGY